jgi:hypothetical protein
LRSTLLRGLAATLAWNIGLGEHAMARPATVASLPAIVRTLTGGEASWRCAITWGWRGRRVESTSIDLQRAPDGCGPAALAAVLRRSQAGISQDLLWSICRLPGGGTTLGRLAWTARRFGQPCRVCWTADPASLPCPAIVHLRRGHFVVLQRCGSEAASVLDPGCGIVSVPRCVLAARASGAALVFDAAAAPAHTPESESSLEEDR